MPITRQGTSNNMTPEAVRAMIDQAIQRNSTNSDGSHSSGGGPTRPVQSVRACSYSDFMKCQPLNFMGTKGVVGLSCWFEKMESIFHISGCGIENQKLRTYAERQTKSKMKFDNNNQAQKIPKRKNVAQAYAFGNGERKEPIVPGLCWGEWGRMCESRGKWWSEAGVGEMEVQRVAGNLGCVQGKQHKASCKSKLVNLVSKPLHTLHMDLFGPTSVSSLNHKWYCLVVTDDFSRFTWTFFLKTKDETSGILRNFITEIENLKDLKASNTSMIIFKTFGR
nr:putative ribonuclease H-like domain-containing protein [Tanacetum cinerariifolium]